MSRILIASAAAFTLAVTGAAGAAEDEGWTSLFDGETLEGWTVSEHPDSIVVENGAIVTRGPRAHAFYTGPVHDHVFRNFVLELEVMTGPGANSGVYFHTEYQAEGWPARGYEAQVNNSHSDWRRTGSLYAIEDVREAPAADGEWWSYRITVDGRRILLEVNGETTVDYSEPEGVERPAEMAGRVLSSGTFAIQCHDPGSVVHFRNIRVRALPD
jgi:hypothetical protein